METLSTIGEVRRRVGEWRSQGLRVGFVPTMGNLHQGHLNLVERLASEADRIIVSIFVNPTQFGANEDFSGYPRTLEADLAKLAPLGVAAVFCPNVAEMYPDGPTLRTRVEVPALSDSLCGAARPGHFAGVATVVSKLFNIVQADIAAFGKKDYQQLRVIEQMVRDLDIPTRILPVDTAREADGLAMSSRNGYLSAGERARAPLLQQTLRKAATRLRNGEPRDVVEAWGRATLDASGFRTDYFELRRQADLSVPTEGDRALVLLAAAWLGKARLLDNLELALNAGS
jgi:pantoate--beta-alanine ligase